MDELWISWGENAAQERRIYLGFWIQLINTASNYERKWPN
jgi:hypothetical protein